MHRPITGIVLAAALAVSLVTLVAAVRLPGDNQGYAPVQPIAYSHKVHAGDLQMQCTYCHFAAEKSRHAGIPPLNVCMNCHSILSTQTVEIEKLKESVQRQQPIAWTKVHNLPDFVYFNHSQHVTGGVSCAACHGANGRSEIPGTPALAGQHGFYAITQLFLFREGRRSNEAMTAVARTLKDDDLRGFAAVIDLSKR